MIYDKMRKDLLSLAPGKSIIYYHGPSLAMIPYEDPELSLDDHVKFVQFCESYASLNRIYFLQRKDENGYQYIAYKGVSK